MNSRELSHFNWEDIGERVLLMGFRIMGLAPFSAQRTTERSYVTFDPSQDSTFIKFSLSYLGCVYNVFLSIAHCSMLCMVIPTLMDINYVNRSKFTEIIDFLGTVVGNTTLFVIWLTFAFRQKSAVILLNKLLNSDSVMPFLKPDSSSRFITIGCVANIALWIGMTTTALIGFNYPLLTHLTYMIALTVCRWFVFQYAFAVTVIENRFVALNRALLERPIPSQISDGLFSPAKVSKKHSPKVKIATIRRTCRCLCETASRISHFYSIPIFFTIALLSSTIVYNAYHVTVPFVTPLKRPPLMIYTNLVLCLIGNSLPIVVLALGVRNVAGEIKKTTDIVRKLLIVTNTQENAEISSMVCTYLIILLQFQMG